MKHPPRSRYGTDPRRQRSPPHASAGHPWRAAELPLCRSLSRPAAGRSSNARSALRRQARGCLLPPCRTRYARGCSPDRFVCLPSPRAPLSARGEALWALQEMVLETLAIGLGERAGPVGQERRITSAVVGAPGPGGVALAVRVEEAHHLVDVAVATVELPDLGGNDAHGGEHVGQHRVPASGGLAAQ